MQTFTFPEPQSAPTATKMDVTKIFIEENSKRMTVEYKFFDATNEPIMGSTGNNTRYWSCSGSDFDNIFGFTIRAQDVGKKVGAALWQLIWSKMKADILKVANNDVA